MSSFARQDADASDASAHSSSSSLLDNTANMIPSMCFAVNILERRIEVVPVEEEARNSTLLFFESIPHRQYLMLGHRIPDDEVDEEKDNYVHCEQCDSFYTYSCLIHPLYRVLDRSDSGYEETLNRAQRTLPAFLCITMSSIPDAGKGVFTKVDIPVGAVFGPYQGILRCEQKKADSDGYSWEIKRDHETVYLDGRDPRFSNWMRYINSSRHEGEQNLIAFQYAGGVYYRVFRPIDHDTELLVWYGAAFGKALCVNTTPPKIKKKKAKSWGGNSGKNPFIY